MVDIVNLLNCARSPIFYTTNSFTVRQPQGHRDRNVTNPPLHLNVATLK